MSHYNGPSRSKRRGGQKNRGHEKRGGRQSSITDTTLLIKKGHQKSSDKYESRLSIAELPISSELKERLSRKGFNRPTEIQERTLSHLLEGKDLIGIAQTGTGKTGAFLIPMIERMRQRKGGPGLVIVPTRELAVQVQEEFRSMTKGMKLFTQCFIGGTNIQRDIHSLRRPAHLVVGTPGRLKDLSTRNALNLRDFTTLVLDEFDRMLDMGFSREIDFLVAGMRNRQQTLLFSATMDRKQQRRVDEIVASPVVIKVSSGEATADHVDQDVIRVPEGEDKFKRLVAMLKQDKFSKVLLFDESKHRVKRLSEKLNRAGISSDQIQGNKSQSARQKALDAFKAGKINVLVATDVAARGIDVDDVTHVINFQLPRTYDTYIHRVGRTGRAGKVGQAYTFIN